MPILKSCCCGCSLQVGTMIIAISYMFLSLPPAVTTGKVLYTANFTYSNRNDTKWESDNEGRLQGGFGVSIIHGIIVIFLLLGAALEIGGLLLPWVVLEVLLMVIVFVIGILISAAIFQLTDHTNVAIIVIVSTLAYELITVYCILVVYSYYQELRDRAKDQQRAQV